jgi:hypothetical protein
MQVADSGTPLPVEIVHVRSPQNCSSTAEEGCRTNTTGKPALGETRTVEVEPSVSAFGWVAHNEGVP